MPERYQTVATTALAFSLSGVSTLTGGIDLRGGGEILFAGRVDSPIS